MQLCLQVMRIIGLMCVPCAAADPLLPTGIMFEQTSHQLWPNINTREQQQQELQDSYPVNTLGAARTEVGC
jgi:hypothetical protein